MGGTQHSKIHCPAPPESEKESYFTDRKGLHIYTHTWEIDSPKGVVCVSHGFGEHILRPGYVELATRLNNAGFIVRGMDHQGHGRSNGERVHVEAFQDYVDDLTDFVKATKEKYPQLPLMLFAHSMGTLIATIMCLQLLKSEDASVITGVVLSAIPLVIDPNIDNAFFRGLSSFLSNVAPKWAPPGAAKIDLKDITRNAEALEVYKKDPLIYKGEFRVLQGYGMVTASRFIQENLAQFSYPILLLHGTEDKLTIPSGSKLFYDKCSSQDKSVVMLQDVFHEPFEDPEKDKFFDEIVKFFTKMVEAPSA